MIHFPLSCRTFSIVLTFPTQLKGTSSTDLQVPSIKWSASLYFVLFQNLLPSLLGETISLPCPNMAEIWHRMALTVGGPLVLGCHTAPLRKEIDWVLMTFLLFPGITGSLHPIPEQDDGRFQQWYVLSAHVGISLPGWSTLHQKSICCILYFYTNSILTKNH